MSDKDISNRALAVGGYTKWVRTGAFFLAPFWLALTIATLFGLFILITSTGEVLATKGEDGYTSDIRWHALTFAALLAALGGLIGAPIAIIRVFVAERQTRATEAQRITAEQGLITDRFTKAVEQLGAEKTVKRIVDGEPQEWTEPNLEVRLGAIYALERIAQDSERDHASIMEVLCAYVRQTSHENFRLDGSRQDPAIEEDVMFLLPEDLRLALLVLDRAMRATLPNLLSESKRPIFDLSNTFFEKKNLYGIELPGAIMTDAYLDGADVGGANFANTQLHRSRFIAADLTKAVFTKSHLWRTDFRETDLRKSNFNESDLQETLFDCANCRGADFEHANNFTQNQLNEMFGDVTTRIPKNLSKPEHWSKSPLSEWYSRDTEYEHWIALGAPRERSAVGPL